MSTADNKELVIGRSLVIDSQEEDGLNIKNIKKRHIWWTLDIHILPLVTLLYLLSFLDRSNIGNAKIAGMATDLHLGGLRYNIAAAVFFITYCFVEVPSNIILMLFRPSRWIPTIMVVWGTIMTLMGFVNTYQGLVIARVFLGLAEGGLFPGVAYYISLWYPRQMQAKRFAIFLSAATVAGAFGGILAYGIEHLDGKAGRHGWQWIFLIEGLATVAIAFVAYFLMHDYPETAKFLSEDERQFIIQTLKEDLNDQATHFSMKFVWQGLADWKTYLHVMNVIGITIPLYSIALFTPTIIHNLGYSAARAQLLSVPPFVCGCITTILIGVYSDKMNLRGPFVILGAAISMIGYIVAYTTSKPGPGYLAAILAASGVFPVIAVMLAWTGGNSGGDMKRGVVLAMIIGMGNLGGICSSFVYYQPPRFYKGHGTNIGCLGMVIVCSSILMWKYRRLNEEKEELCAREGIDESMHSKYRDLADQSPLFRYVI